MFLEIVSAIDPGGCRELPFIQSAAQTYSDYMNGAVGYIIFIVGGTILLASLVSRKLLGKVPGWFSFIVITGLALAALPTLLGAFGIDLGCAGGGGAVVGGEPTGEHPAPIPPEQLP